MVDARVLLAPGASGNPASLERVLAGLAARGIEGRVVSLAAKDAERAVPQYRSAVLPVPLERAVIGGQSFGGRVASLLAAEEAPAGLVLIAYPLHAPGRHEAWEARTSHWQRIRCPVLLLSGDADPFARVDLLRRAVRQLADAELVIYPGLGHGLGPHVEDAAERIADFAWKLPRA